MIRLASAFSITLLLITLMAIVANHYRQDGSKFANKTLTIQKATTAVARFGTVVPDSVHPDKYGYRVTGKLDDEREWAVAFEKDLSVKSVEVDGEKVQ